MRRRIIGGWLPAVLWAGLIFALSSIPGTSLPTVAIPQADKMVHTLVYAILGYLVLRALESGPAPGSEPGSERDRRAPRALPGLALVILAVTLATLYGISDELHQLWTPNRSADWRDVVADALGGTLGTLALVGGRWMKIRACFMMRPSKD